VPDCVTGTLEEKQCMSKRTIAIIFAGFFTLFVAFAIRYAYGLLLPYMLPSLGISKTGAGIIYSSYFITYTVLSPLLGLLVDRFDARKILTIFVIIMGAAAYLMSISSSLIQASIFFALAGVGHSACWVPVVTVVQRWVSETRRGMALAFVDLGSASGIVVWSMVIPLIIGAFTWRSAWVSLGLCSFAAAGLNFFSIRSYPPVQLEHRGTQAESNRRISIRVTYSVILRDKKFYLIGLSYFLLSFSILIPFTFLTTYVTQVLMLPYKSATELLAVLAAAGAVGKLILSHLSDNAGRIRIMMLCGVLVAAGGLGMGLVQSLSGLTIFSVVLGVGYGTIWPVYAASSQDFFSKEYAGSVVGLWTVYHGAGSIISPILTGWTIDTTGSYTWMFVLVITSAVLSSLLLLPINNKEARIGG
jgi:OFA family oxalate/formate antiporter-like MFS transporter